MAKERLTDGTRATSKRQKQQQIKKNHKDDREPPSSASFSESELDVARQLVQLSGNSDESTTAASSTAAAGRRVLDDGTEASSVLRDIFCPEEEFGGVEEGRRRKRFRSLQEIYELTGPRPTVIISLAARANKMACR